MSETQNTDTHSAPAPATTPLRSRVAFAAAHVVADPAAPQGPGIPVAVDWDATLAFRRHLWSLGLGVADAMDTAQRGMGLDWAATKELIARSGAAAREAGGSVACGAGTDHLTPAQAAETTLSQIRSAYLEQIAVVEDADAQVVLMASRALAAAARGPADYAELYSTLLSQVSRPAILHWLGTPFDAALEGYWGSSDLDVAAESVLAIIKANAGKVDGIKVSLLDADREIALRRALPDGVKLYTGDDFNYPELIKGDEQGHSHALLGIFDPIAAQAAKALSALDRGDVAGFDAILGPTVPLARHVFAAPTRHYKTGVVFLAYLSGHQDHFVMVAGAQENRSTEHLTELYRLAQSANILPDPELAESRMRTFLAARSAT